MEEVNAVVVDTVHITVNEQDDRISHICDFSIDDILIELCINDFKSLFFLLLDYINPKRYLIIIKNDLDTLKSNFIDFYHDAKIDRSLLIELFGTMKKYNILKKLGTCKHEFIQNRNTFNKINKLWKLLYCVCEEIGNSEFSYMKNFLYPNNNREACSIETIEELFCEALLDNKLQKNDLSVLKAIFSQLKPHILTILTSYDEESQRYFFKEPITFGYCGIALIINHEKFYKDSDDLPDLKCRESSKRDAEELSNLWLKFGFKVMMYDNLIDTEVMELITNLANNDHSSYDAFIFCYLSHGSKGVIYATNSKPILINHIIDNIEKSSTLKGKPKLFFFQACQGDAIQAYEPNTQGTKCIQNKKNETDAFMEIFNIPKLCDIYIIISSIPGYASFCDSLEGAVFINSLVKNMNLYGTQEDIKDVITKVTKDVSSYRGMYKNQIVMQTVISHSTLRFKLIFKKRWY